MRRVFKKSSAGRAARVIRLAGSRLPDHGRMGYPYGILSVSCRLSQQVFRQPEGRGLAPAPDKRGAYWTRA